MKIQRENEIIYLLSVALCILLTALVFTTALLLHLTKEVSTYKKDLATLIYITKPMIESNVSEMKEPNSEVKGLDSENFQLLPVE